ncbi:MAG TPA: HD domain-containing phosphohydrolase [Burkholderiales bacterium]
MTVDGLNQRLSRLHREVCEYFPFVVRISVALHDPQTDEIKTFLHSPIDETPLAHYRVPLSQAGWLNNVRESRRSRVIGELEPATLGKQAHSLRILAAGYKASYTVPIFDENRFLGFVFFNSDKSGVFSDRVTRQLDLFVRIISLTIESALRFVDILVGSLNLLREISGFRDVETSSHLSRMSYYSEIIAREAAPELGQPDTWVEYLRLFAPLHDIGKIATPDAILLKAGRLNDAEYEIMKQHAAKGEAIVTTLIDALALGSLPHVECLRNIARHHHERWDGSGYPDGLRGDQIPPEARIARIADVFDALTSRRCYKEAWPVETARKYVEERAGTEFDPRFSEIFLSRNEKIAEIMGRFKEESSEAT